MQPATHNPQHHHAACNTQPATSPCSQQHTTRNITMQPATHNPQHHHAACNTQPATSPCSQQHTTRNITMQPATHNPQHHHAACNTQLATSPCSLQHDHAVSNIIMQSLRSTGFNPFSPKMVIAQLAERLTEIKPGAILTRVRTFGRERGVWRAWGGGGICVVCV